MVRHGVNIVVIPKHMEHMLFSTTRWTFKSQNKPFLKNSLKTLHVLTTVFFAYIMLWVQGDVCLFSIQSSLSRKSNQHRALACPCFATLRHQRRVVLISLDTIPPCVLCHLWKDKISPYHFCFQRILYSPICRDGLPPLRTWCGGWWESPHTQEHDRNELYSAILPLF